MQMKAGKSGFDLTSSKSGAQARAIAALLQTKQMLDFLQYEVKCML